MDRTTGREAYRAAREIVVRHRDDYDAAIAAFHWPDVGAQFDWALDWFDPVDHLRQDPARRPTRT